MRSKSKNVKQWYLQLLPFGSILLLLRFFPSPFPFFPSLLLFLFSLLALFFFPLFPPLSPLPLTLFLLSPSLSSPLLFLPSLFLSPFPPFLPLFFSQNDAEPYIVMFKKGDDLRKDILVLNAFRTMDHIWKNDGLDLRMTPYSVVMTGLDSGLVQVIFFRYWNIDMEINIKYIEIKR